MDSEEKPGKGKSKGKARGSRKRKDPQPSLHPEVPLDEGAPAASHPEVPETGGKGRQKISSQQTGEPKSMRVAEIMTDDPVCCLPDTPLVRVARMMAENSCGAIPVIGDQEGRAPLGIVTDRDVAVRTVAQGRNPLEMTAGDVMSPSLVSIGPEDTVEHCADLMRSHQLRRIVVVDSRGRVCGLVVQAQIARHLPKFFSGETLRDISQPPPQ